MRVSSLRKYRVYPVIYEKEPGVASLQCTSNTTARTCSVRAKKAPITSTPVPATLIFSRRLPSIVKSSVMGKKTSKKQKKNRHIIIGVTLPAMSARHLSPVR